MKKILIADDSLFMRKVLKDIVSKATRRAHQILEAESGAEALALVKKENVDLVLLDIIMPGGQEEGVRVLQAIIKMKPEMRVIMITAVGQNAMIDTCRDLGAVDYIVKPFDEEDVAKKVAEHVR